MDGDTRVPCFGCGAKMKNIYEDGNQPSRGLEFVTYGHYGSQQFDPMDGTAIAINICDQCLDDRRERILHYDQPKVVRTHPSPPTLWKDYPNT